MAGITKKSKGGITLYRNLMAEMRRRGITGRQLADALGLKAPSVYAKLHGRVARGFTPPEKETIGRLLGVRPDEPLYELLFERSA